MPDVRIGSEIKTYPQGTAYAEIAEEYQKNYENDILLVSVNGRLRELHKTLQKGCQMEFITAADTAGYLAYQRSAVFLMMKAFQDVAGRENVKNITVCFSVENGLYVEVEGGITLSQELLDRVKEEISACLSRICRCRNGVKIRMRRWIISRSRACMTRRVCSITGGRRGSMFTGSAIMTTISTDIWS